VDTTIQEEAVLNRRAQIYVHLSLYKFHILQSTIFKLIN